MPWLARPHSPSRSSRSPSTGHPTRHVRAVLYPRRDSHNRRFYTHADPRRFDHFGLVRLESALSRDGSLTATVTRLVQEAEVGWTPGEPRSLLHVPSHACLMLPVQNKGAEKAHPARLQRWRLGLPVRRPGSCQAASPSPQQQHPRGPCRPRPFAGDRGPDPQPSLFPGTAGTPLAGPPPPHPSG